MLQTYFRKQLEQKISRGIIVVDKEAGITSHDEVDRLRRIFGTRKVGHSGTLDPKVTGVLVCGLGRGTKVLEYVLLSEKVYDTEIVFHKKVNQRTFEQVLQDYQGVITQLPPVKSRVKREERKREVYTLELISFALDGRSARVRCAVESGTYIRKLCHDIGESLGTGAHMGELRRIQAGPISEDKHELISSKKLQQIKKKAAYPLVGWWYWKKLSNCIQPVECIVGHMPQVHVDPQLKKVITSGAPLYGPGVVDCDEPILEGDLVTVVDTLGSILAVGRAQMNHRQMNKKKKGVAVQVTKILV